LSVRWAEAVERVQNELPGDHPLRGACNGMQSELALDDLLDGLEADLAAMVPAAPSPETREAVREVREMQRQFNACSLEIKQAQAFLARAVNDWRHRLLADISTDCFHVPGLYPTAVNAADFSSTQARQAAKDMLPRLQWARGVVAKINEARSFEAQPIEQRCMALIEALWTRLQDSRGRVIALEAQTTALEARLDRLEQRKKPKRKAAA
jgi:hypothetical protein